MLFFTKILLAIDDSLSMKEKDVGFFALESLTVLSLALTKAKFSYFYRDLGDFC